MIVSTIAAALVAAGVMYPGVVQATSRQAEPPKAEAPKNCGPSDEILTALSKAGFKITWSGKFDNGVLVIGQIPASTRWVAVVVSEAPKVACILQTGAGGKVAGEVI